MVGQLQKEHKGIPMSVLPSDKTVRIKKKPTVQKSASIEPIPERPSLEELAPFLTSGTMIAIKNYGYGRPNIHQFCIQETIKFWKTWKEYERDLF